jgi:hypothetical protein
MLRLSRLSLQHNYVNTVLFRMLYALIQHRNIHV